MMQCQQCNRELPAGASHCPYCGATVATASPVNAGSAIPQAFCVKCGASLHLHGSFCPKCSAPRATAGAQQANPGFNQSNFTPSPTVAPVAPVIPVAGQLSCPRCGSTNVIKGKIAQWAMIVAIVGFLVICFLSLLFLLIKEPNRCLTCSYEFK